MATARDLDRVANETLKRLRDVSGVRGLGYNRSSVIWLDSFIERQRKLPGMTPELVDGMIENLGCYFGRCIIATYGGRWAELSDGWAVQFDATNAVFPFNKIAKQFENGPGDSIRSMFEVIPKIYPNAPSPRPWWKLW